MKIQNKIQRAANQKANQLMKHNGSHQTGFEKTWRAIECLFPSADPHTALEYATSLASKRG